MKRILTIAILLGMTFGAFAQSSNEYAPIKLPSHGLIEDQDAYLPLTATQTIDLTVGWNWVSLNLVIDNPVSMLDQLKEKLGDNAEQIQSFEYTTDYEGDGEWFGDLDEEGVTNDQMYMINVVTNCSIELEGTRATDIEEYTITINPGWNWIGFPSGEAINVNDAMADFESEEGDQIQSKDNTADCEGVGEWFGDLETLEPGEGYMYYSLSDEVKTLVFRTGSKK